MIKFSVLEDSDAFKVQIYAYDVQSNILDYKLLHLVQVENLKGYYTTGHIFDSNPIKEGGVDQKLFFSWVHWDETLKSKLRTFLQKRHTSLFGQEK